jgi:chromosome segregation ATPase
LSNSALQNSRKLHAKETKALNKVKVAFDKSLAARIKERDDLTHERNHLQTERDDLIHERDHLQNKLEGWDNMKEVLDKEKNKSLRLIGDRTKVSNLLQDEKKKVKEQAQAAQTSIAALNTKVKRLQASLRNNSQNEALQPEVQRLEKQIALMHQQSVDLQRKNETLTTDIRRFRSATKTAEEKHESDLRRNRKELEKIHRVKITKRDAVQQHERAECARLRAQLAAVQRAGNEPMAPVSNAPMAPPTRPPITQPVMKTRVIEPASPMILALLRSHLVRGFLAFCWSRISC